MRDVLSEAGRLDCCEPGPTVVVYFTGDDHGYRFDTNAKRRFLDLLRERFNTGVRFGNSVLKWDTVIEQKTAELGRFLIGRSTRLDFAEPTPTLHRIDDRELRKRILSLSQPDAAKLGIGKSTLHYLRRNAKAARPLRVYGKVAARIRDTEPRNADVMW
jgi:CRISPR-associated protein Cas1